MNVKILNKMPKFMIRLGASVRENLPEILMFLGGASSIGAIAYAVNVTPKAEAILESASFAKETGTYTLQDKARDAMDISKLYAPAAVLEIVSLGCFAGAHNVMARRQQMLYAAYVALEQTFDAYRQRAIARYGAAEDQYFLTGMTPGQTVNYVDPETGEVKTDTDATVFDENTTNGRFTMYFDESSREWCKSPTTNMMKLKGLEKQFDDLLHLRGYVFANEVSKALDLPQTADGQIFGWVDDPEHGECHVDIGITNGYQMVEKALTEHMYTRAILLHYNVDKEPIHKLLDIRNKRRILETTPGPLTMDKKGRLIDELPVPEYPVEG